MLSLKEKQNLIPAESVEPEAEIEEAEFEVMDEPAEEEAEDPFPASV